MADSQATRSSASPMAGCTTGARSRPDLGQDLGQISADSWVRRRRVLVAEPLAAACRAAGLLSVPHGAAGHAPLSVSSLSATVRPKMRDDDARRERQRARSLRAAAAKALFAPLRAARDSAHALAPLARGLGRVCVGSVSSRGVCGEQARSPAAWLARPALRSLAESDAAAALGARDELLALEALLVPPAQAAEAAAARGGGGGGEGDAAGGGGGGGCAAAASRKRRPGGASGGAGGKRQKADKGSAAAGGARAAAGGCEGRPPPLTVDEVRRRVASLLSARASEAEHEGGAAAEEGKAAHEAASRLFERLLEVQLRAAAPGWRPTARLHAALAEARSRTYLCRPRPCRTPTSAASRLASAVLGRVVHRPRPHLGLLRPRRFAALLAAR